MKSLELKCLCFSTCPVDIGSNHEATKIYLLLWPMSCCHERNRGRMSHSPGCGHRNAVWRPAPGWEEADDGVGGRRLVQMGPDVFNIQWSVQYTGAGLAQLVRFWLPALYSLGGVPTWWHWVDECSTYMQFKMASCSCLVFLELPPTPHQPSAGFVFPTDDTENSDSANMNSVSTFRISTHCLRQWLYHSKIACAGIAMEECSTSRMEWYSVFSLYLPGVQNWNGCIHPTIPGWQNSFPFQHNLMRTTGGNRYVALTRYWNY